MRYFLGQTKCLTFSILKLLKKQQKMIDENLNAAFIAFMKANFNKCVKYVSVGALSVLVFSCAAPNTAQTSFPAPLPEGQEVAASPQDSITAAPLASAPTYKKSTSRPGLATQQGRSMNSKVETVRFERASKTKPKGQASIYYNNQEGVDAMVGSPWKLKGASMKSAAGGLVEWGVRSGFRYAPNYYTSGYTKRLVVGKKGREYSIVIKNTCT